MGFIFKHEGNRHDAFNVRASVFMVEQGFTYDFDKLDDDDRVIHITCYEESAEDRPIGTARIFPAAAEWQYPEFLDATENGWVVGRIAVLSDARRSGLGSKILREAEKVALDNGADEMHLHAQVRAMPFYEKSGYVSYGGIEDDEGVDHQWMRKKLD